MKTKPFLRWPGGKAQLMPLLRKRMPEYIGTYVEPFVGGGALFYDTCPTQAVLNDANFKLVNLYINVRDHKDELVANLASYELEYNSLNSIEAKQDFYYQTRSDFNADFKINYTARDAAQLVFINKTCFNGLYRENAAGEFNAAFGKRMTVKLYDADNLDCCSNALQDVVLMDGDFEVACRNLTAGDFVYFDPPYHSTFNAYQKGGFSEDDQVRLHDLFQRLTDAGVQCMVSNSNTTFIRSLYAGYNMEVVQAMRMINRNGNDRKGEELIITNYKSNNTRK